MRSHAGRLVFLLIPLLLAACGLSAQRNTTALLNDRLQDRLANDIKAGQAVVQPVPNGARVTLLGPNMFPNDKLTLDDTYPDIRANVIEGLLDPTLMQVRVTDTTTLPDDQRQTRVNNVTQYFAANGLERVLQPAEPRQLDADAGPAGLAITIAVQCPRHRPGFGYQGGPSQPICE